MFAAVQRNNLRDFSSRRRLAFGLNDARGWEVTLVDVAIAWLLAPPVQGVGGLAVLSAVIGLLLPRAHDITDHGHPHC